jgi:hypothetical protein
MGAQERRRQKRIRDFVITRDGLICCYCNCPLTIETVTMEHIVPDSKRGTFNSTNLTVSCSGCNNRRGNKPFFEYCKNFDFTEEKLEKYRKLYFSNLRIKILNIAKEECLSEPEAIPTIIIKQACSILKIKVLDFSEYETIHEFGIKFNENCEKRKIKYWFEQLIKIIELDNS